VSSYMSEDQGVRREWVTCGYGSGDGGDVMVPQYDAFGQLVFPALPPLEGNDVSADDTAAMRAAHARDAFLLAAKGYAHACTMLEVARDCASALSSNEFWVAEVAA
jgi:hypothetical protein